MINAGDLKHRVTIQQSSSTRNSFGEAVQTWTTLATVWAGKQNLTIKDIDRQRGQEAQAEARLLIRHRTDVTTAMRVQFKGTTYHIVGLEDYQDGEGLLLFVRKT